MRRVLLLILALGALLSCQKEAVEQTYHAVPFSAWVEEWADTRATVGGQHYVFQPDDRVYVSATGADADKLYGFLHLIAGEGENRAHFEGMLYCADDFTLSASTPVALTLVSADDRLHQLKEGRMTGSAYPENAYSASFAQAVEQYSDFTGTGSFGDAEFHLSQQSTFLILTLKMSPAEAPAGSEVSLSLASGGAPLWENQLTLENAGVVQLCIPFAGGSVTLSDASLSVNWGDSHSKVFNDLCRGRSKTLERNNYYTLSRVTLEYAGFRIVAREDNTVVTFNYYGNNIQYSTDLGFSWIPYNAVAPITLEHEGDILCFKGERANYDNSNGSTPLFTANKQCYIAGNIMSLLPDENVLPDYAFRRAFSYSNGSKTPSAYTWIDIDPADPLLLPVTTLSTGCYYEMFRACTTLTCSPHLPASDMASLCYYGLFRQCSHLQTIYCNINAFTGTPGDYVKANYDRAALKANLDKWALDISASGTIYAHPDMVTYWTNARTTNSGWYASDYQFASIPTGWSVSTY